MTFLIVIALAALPAYAAQRLVGTYPWLALYAVAVSAITYWVYAVDKRRAEHGEWRVPEAHLHLLELLGGWPGAFLAQRRLRHKCSKGSYQFVFWLIVLIYQCAAFDSFQHWRYSQGAWKHLEQTSNRRR